jgi:hypothetical protein
VTNVFWIYRPYIPPKRLCTRNHNNVSESIFEFELQVVVCRYVWTVAWHAALLFCLFNSELYYSQLLRKQSSVEIVIPGIFLGGLEKITEIEINATVPQICIWTRDIRIYPIKFLFLSADRECCLYFKHSVTILIHLYKEILTVSDFLNQNFDLR